MSIEATLEVAKGEYLPLEDNVIASKAIASFCTSALVGYCYLHSQQLSNMQIDAQDRELFNWFSAVASHMTTDICLLSEVIWGYWNYSDTEYDRYVNDMNTYFEHIPSFEGNAEKILSEQEFLETCRLDQQTWTDPIRLNQVAEDLVRVFGETHPPEMWWYHPEITPAHFRALAKTLLSAAEKGFTKVRLNCG